MPTLTAPDGTPLAYDAYEPDRPRAAVLFLAGWQDHAGRWADVGERLREAGLAVYCLDLRGQGRSGGRRGYLSRFSQLLGDLQALRRLVRRQHDAPHLILGHSFGALVALRYLETQPSDPIAAAVISSPFLGLASPPPHWHGIVNRLLADLWPTVPLRSALDPAHLSRDAGVNAAYARDALVHGLTTPGAWAEIRWAQEAISTDRHRIDCPLLCLLAGADRIADAHLARAFADGLKSPVEVRWYPDMYHELLHDPERERVLVDLLAFVERHV